MSFFVTSNESALDLVTKRLHDSGEFDDRYEAIAGLQTISMDEALHEAAIKGGFARVASLQGPLLDLAKVLDPDFLRDKRKFYHFLDTHPQHCTYDRRKNAQPNQITFSDGKLVL